ncbi:PspC domain-containing protein [Candidatus Woesebacteria bacterium]|nr:PspC domain-containing protein [Candidatus Woesebacteria bacterium]
MTARKKLLRRPKKGRKIAGVALGISNYFNIDVVVVRLVFVLLAIPGGLPGIVPYIICWIVIPSRD